MFNLLGKLDFIELAQVIDPNGKAIFGLTVVNSELPETDVVNREGVTRGGFCCILGEVLSELRNSKALVGLNRDKKKVWTSAESHFTLEQCGSILQNGMLVSETKHWNRA